MKKAVTFLLCMAMVMTMFSCITFSNVSAQIPSAGTNLIPSFGTSIPRNPGASTWWYDYSSGTSCSINLVTTDLPTGGTGTVAMVWNNNNGQVYTGVSNLKGLKPNTTYRFSAYARCDININTPQNGLNGGLFSVTVGSQTYRADWNVGGNTQWRSVEATFTTASTVTDYTNFTVNINLNNASGWMQFYMVNLCEMTRNMSVLGSLGDAEAAFIGSPGVNNVSDYGWSFPGWAGWTNNNGSNFIRQKATDSTYPNGGDVFVIETNASGDPAYGAIQLQNLNTIKPNTKYKFGFWVKTYTGGNTLNITVNAGSTLCDIWIGASENWVYIEREFTTGSDISTSGQTISFDCNWLVYSGTNIGYRFADMKLYDMSLPVPQGYSSGADHGYGLRVDSQGVLKIGGNQFYGMGVNFYDVIQRLMANPNLDFSSDFATLENNDIPFIRTMMPCFYPDDFMLYLNDKEYYFKQVDKVVRLAEKYHVGIVLSLMWNFSTIPDVVGESLNQIGNPNSKSLKLAREYVTDVVNRYKNSPAIWAWEIGNEANLAADLGGVSTFPANLPGTTVGGAPATRTTADYITTYQLTNYYAAVGSAIRAVDSYRMVVGGDSEPRGSSKSLRELSSWSPTDTYADTKETLAYYSPYPLDAVSVHMYQYETTPIRDFTDIITDLYQMSTELKKVLFIGEFGPGSNVVDNQNDSIPETDPAVALEMQTFYANYNGVLSSGAQISAVWCWGTPGDATSILPGQQKQYQWNAIINANAGFIVNGKQNTTAYWNNATDLFTDAVLSNPSYAAGTNLLRVSGDPSQMYGLAKFAPVSRVWWWFMQTGIEGSVTLQNTTLANGTTGKVMRYNIPTLNQSGQPNAGQMYSELSCITGLKPNSTYQLSMKAKSSNLTVTFPTSGQQGGSLSFSIGGNSYGADVIIGGTNDWITVDRTFVTSSSITEASIGKVYLSLINCTGTMDVYDIKLVEVPTGGNILGALGDASTAFIGGAGLNSVTNYGFTFRGWAGWTNENGLFRGKQSGTDHNGVTKNLFAMQKTAAGNSYGYVELQNIDFLKPGTSYTLSCWVKTSNLANQLNISVGDSVSTYGQANVSATTGWTQVTFSFTTPATISSGLAIKFSAGWMTAANMSYYFDNVVLVKN